jgi:hypothetical protein
MSVTIQVDFVDCDYSTAGENDFVYLAVYPVAEGQNPCEVSPSLAECEGDNSSFSFTLDNVQSNTDYVVVAGSNHIVQGSNAEDPCSFDVTISGGAVDIEAVILDGVATIILGQEATLQVNGADSDSTILWSPLQFVETPTQATTLAYPTETMVFQVTGTVGECPLVAEVIVTVTDPISVEEQENTLINLFPIPARDLINVQLTTPAPWAITDITGRTIMAKQSASYVFTINIESLPIGVYFLHSNESRIRFVKE